MSMNTNPRNHASGFTLIELLVGLTVGSILITALVFAWSLTVRTNSYILSTTALNNDLRSFMQIISQDIRRALPTEERSSVYLHSGGANGSSNVSEANCILYVASTSSPDGQDVNDEPYLSGFRLTDSQLQMWFSENILIDFADPNITLPAGTIKASEACNTTDDEGWHTVIQNSDRGILVNNLNFNVGNSLCMDLDIDSDDLQSGRCPANSTNKVEVIFVEITISGEVSLPGGNQPFQFMDAIKVRNDRVIN